MANYIKAIMTIETTDPEEIERLLDHHIDYLIDMDENPDIQSIAGVISYDIESKHDKDKLRMLSSVVSDILETDPSDKDLNYDDDYIELYSRLRSLKESLEKTGLM